MVDLVLHMGAQCVKFCSGIPHIALLFESTPDDFGGIRGPGRPARFARHEADQLWASGRPKTLLLTRLQLHALAYNLGKFLRTLVTLEAIADWSLTSLREKLIKIGAKVVSHGRYVTFQMAEVAISRQLFASIMQRIAALRSPPMVATT
jgi:hypothetical protein